MVIVLHPSNFILVYDHLQGPATSVQCVFEDAQKHIGSDLQKPQLRCSFPIHTLRKVVHGKSFINLTA